jgi:hypothetical protein
MTRLLAATLLLAGCARTANPPSVASAGAGDEALVASASSGGDTPADAEEAATRSATMVPGAEVPEFPSQDADRWLNGTPFTLASARGNVVLVESWHRT